MTASKSTHLILFKASKFFQIVSGAKVPTDAVKNSNVDFVIGLKLLESSSEMCRRFLD